MPDRQMISITVYFINIIQTMAAFSFQLHEKITVAYFNSLGALSRPGQLIYNECTYIMLIMQPPPRASRTNKTYCSPQPPTQVVFNRFYGARRNGGHYSRSTTPHLLTSHCLANLKTTATFGTILDVYKTISTELRPL